PDLIILQDAGSNKPYTPPLGGQSGFPGVRDDGLEASRYFWLGSLPSLSICRATAPSIASSSIRSWAIGDRDLGLMKLASVPLMISSVISPMGSGPTSAVPAKPNGSSHCNGLL